jgi:EAL domain-containing protein (putative c-di-GMP-specific phosphodiesterase class I)
VIAETAVDLVQRFGLGVIAKVVETETRQESLACSGGQAYQGYFFSRLLPWKKFRNFAAASMCIR